ncbi:L-dopachrome tautomerase yellow-f2, partial [Pseudolycoriella hygida]
PHLHPDKNRIVSVYRPRVDNCGRLWFVDTGTLQYTFPENPNKTIHMLQRPSIWVIDMKTDELVERFEMPEMPGHGLVSITVDVGSKKCGDAFAYIPDLLTFRLHVYSLRRNKMWSFEHPSFKFEEQYASFDVDSFQYTWRDGIFSIALGDRENDGYRAAYYHPMASLSEYKVNTRVLQNKAASKRLNHGDDFQKIGERGFKSQCTMHSLDRHTGVIMFAEVAKNGVSCWNSYKPLHKGNIQLIDKDDVKMIYPVDLNIDRDGIMWMVTNTMQRFIYGKLDPNTYNFRIWRAN